jgi:hypothetical protein
MPHVDERRCAIRIDKLFRVLVSTEEHGDQWCLARNISTKGLFVEMPSPLALKTRVIVRFQLPGEDAFICAMGRVQNHYYWQFCDGDQLRRLSGVGIRILRFVADAGAAPDPARLH